MPVAPLPKERHLAFVIVLGILTLGIYPIIWFYLTYKESRECLGQAHKAGVALTLAIVTYVILLLGMALYVATIFDFAVQGAKSPDAGPDARGVATLFSAMGVLILGALGHKGVLIWMTWGAAYGAQDVAAARGQAPTMHPLIHVLVPIVFNPWTIVAMAVIQNDLNRLHHE